MGQHLNGYSVLGGKSEGKRLLECLGTYGRVILKLILNTYVARFWNGFIWLILTWLQGIS
jgi:hypothetical protein